MATQVMSRERIDALNARAVEIQQAGGVSDYKAVKQAAQEAGIKPVIECHQCSLYEDADGALVNLWIDAPSAGIKPGGMGFDDRVEWSEDEDEDETETETEELATPADHRNFWTEREARAAGDMDARRCIHGEPMNVFCGKCER